MRPRRLSWLLPVLGALSILAFDPFSASAGPPAARIVFMHGGDLFTVLPDGSALHRLTRSDRVESAPEWSPSHSMIAFVSARRSIHVVDAGGTAERRIFPLPHRFDAIGSVTWAPAGDELAFTSVRQTRTDHGPRICGQVWVMSASGAGAHRILTGRLSPAGLSWSPGGGALVAAFEVPNGTVECRQGEKTGLFRFDPSGQHLRSLDARFATDPDWSPDGRNIAFRDWRRVCHACGEIWEMSPTGTHQHPILSPPSRYLGYYGPAWSPDGRFLSFIAQRNGRFSLWRARADGTRRYRIRRHADEADW
ncbi:MAG: TolB family protein [Actinomycetota bacterium]